MLEIYHKVKPHVTAWSVSLPQCEHGQEVLVGGKLLQVMDLSPLVEEEGVYLTLDDGLGTISIVMPSSAYEHFQHQLSFQKGDLLLARGRVFVLNTTPPPSKKKKNNRKEPKPHPEKTIHVFSWELLPIPEEALSEASE
mgnify:CR=1 FL=1